MLLLKASLILGAGASSITCSIDDKMDQEPKLTFILPNT